MKLERPLILASSSPRRQYLLKEAGFQFQIEKPDVDEIFPDDLPVDQVARYLALVKADHFRPRVTDQIIVAADTVVILDGRILNKPADREEAVMMLSSLAGKTHRVMTGVSIISKEKEVTFDDTTAVTFEALSKKEIEFYIDQFRPYDKAGAYGAQDCLPLGMNPCSDEEMLFLRNIGREDLIRQTITQSDPGVVIIKKIAGSYFNVMGLPIHNLHRHLSEWN
jgi:septum formation protein